MSIQVPKNENHIAQMFDRIAPRYDLLNRLLSAKQDQRWRKQMVRHIPCRPEGTLVDVATGTGDVLIASRKAHPEYGRFVGVDISKAMLAIARRKAQSIQGCEGLEFSQMSAEGLDFPSNSIDAITISFGYRNVVHKKLALEEFYRSLAPGGKVLILEFFRPSNTLFARAFQFYFNHILPFIGGILSDRDAYRYLPESVAGFQSVDHLRDDLIQVGFTIETTKKFLFGSCCLIVGTK